MILYRPYKLPTGKLNLDGRMRKVRGGRDCNVRALAEWLKRRNHC